MRGFTVEYFKSLTDAIARVEEGTSAEVVVVVEPRSGSYWDVDLAAGAGVALAALTALMYSPWVHTELVTLVDVVVFFALGAWLSSAVPAIRRALTRSARRSLQVRDASAASFYLEKVWTTTGRTGILVYLSLLERELVVLADRGVTSAVPEGAWNDCLATLRSVPAAADPPQALLAALEETGRALAAALPPGADNPDELPNLPRARAR
jgi:putative membrane protein